MTLAPAAGGAALGARHRAGHPADQQAVIFEPFEHLEPVQRKHTPGVGLGLAVVRELVQSLGGRIEAGVAGRPGQYVHRRRCRRLRGV